VMGEDPDQGHAPSYRRRKRRGDAAGTTQAIEQFRAVRAPERNRRLEGGKPWRRPWTTWPSPRPRPRRDSRRPAGASSRSQKPAVAAALDAPLFARQSWASDADCSLLSREGSGGEVHPGTTSESRLELFDALLEGATA